jgi:hypothetical protein
MGEDIGVEETLTDPFRCKEGHGGEGKKPQASDPWEGRQGWVLEETLTSDAIEFDG